MPEAIRYAPPGANSEAPSRCPQQSATPHQERTAKRLRDARSNPLRPTRSEQRSAFAMPEAIRPPHQERTAKRLRDARGNPLRPNRSEQRSAFAMPEAIRPPHQERTAKRLRDATRQSGAVAGSNPPAANRHTPAQTSASGVSVWGRRARSGASTSRRGHGP